MKTATVGDIQKNFAKVLNGINNGQEVLITKRGKPVARIVALAPQQEIEWPDFYSEALDLKGKSLSEIVIEDRAERF
ncbi:MAG: type II toxin-antitoxin system prevent-host-death family antitoxin [Deltaproteobacteria bacterium]|nr:type II toxin-antitoxin system prevent-host-death family antitoxin [Candidatus Tharpella aukensis]